MAVARLAVESGIGGNEHALDQRMIFETPKKFLGGIGRALFANQFETLQRKVLAELFAQGFGDIGHLAPIQSAADVEPVQELIEAIGWLAPSLEKGLEVVKGLRFDVRHEEERVTLKGGRGKAGVGGISHNVCYIQLTCAF